MRIFGANITVCCISFFESSNKLPLDILNSKIKSICGITSFFSIQSEIHELIDTILNQKYIVCESDRAEYGDFQTNKNLSNNICKLLCKQNISPEIIIEPTCGKGNFIISSIGTFKNIKFIYGIEIYKPYVWETKFTILDYFLNNNNSNIPEITIHHCNVFDFDFNEIYSKHKNQKILIIGNPPWVTNSKLSTLESDNLPIKSNFKKHNGFDAITGKGNFDISEYISIKLLSIFANQNGNFSFLVKNSVVKNILLEQNKIKYRISKIQQFDIDAKKEFNVSVNACLILCSLNNEPDFTINEYNFYTTQRIRKYGWINQKFVADVDLYLSANDIDGKFPFVWRQGVKHDASKIMELDKLNDFFINNNNEKVFIENDLVFCLLKSSDLKGNIIDTSRKYTIITQNKIGQETKYIKYQFPETYKYLMNNIEYFNKRKSSIYKGKPLFSIFGIGDYSFKPYKVAISGMYKATIFSLVKSNFSKPIMLDDTCYCVGFDTLIEAEITRFLLNKQETQKFIQSIAFKDAKRMITKDLLMRIDLCQIANNTDITELKVLVEDICEQDWIEYKESINKNDNIRKQQMTLFQESDLFAYGL
jgi:hypothetical protein